MNALPESDSVTVIIRFLLRFADLMSNGSNSANLLLAAQLLEANVKRANEAEEHLRREKAIRAGLETHLTFLSREDHVQIPTSILRLTASQFESMARAFQKSGDVISQTMCEASVVTLDRVLGGEAHRDEETPVFSAIEANRNRSALG